MLPKLRLWESLCDECERVYDTRNGEGLCAPCRELELPPETGQPPGDRNER